MLNQSAFGQDVLQQGVSTSEALQNKMDLSTAIKYWTNKHWAFEQHKIDNTKKEVAQFIFITLIFQ